MWSPPINSSKFPCFMGIMEEYSCAPDVEGQCIVQAKTTACPVVHDKARSAKILSK